MRDYEACCVLRVEDDKFAIGKDAVRNILTSLGAENLKEDDMQVRTIAFPINKIHQGHYYLFDFQMNPENAHKIEHEVRLVPELLRILVSHKDS